MGKTTNPEPKERLLGTRVGKFLNKLEKLEAQEAAELADAPKTIKAKFAKKRGKLKMDQDHDVLTKLGIDHEKDEDCKAYQS